MGTVLAFAPSARAARRAPRGLPDAPEAPRGPAQLLLFLGVRYERDADAPAARSPERGEAGERDADQRRLG